ncbi:mechanosensitive ion channel domain-containing protein [Kordia algicida OT-1]|uniref:Mechanosensitive ion channel family protein n=1 Tax=Kordia algicida OT-1 TaxID=391587 RepID=A9DPJ5_9FLAO|nr:mechanosensitive ion channel domain-containing protein [Kordia algicida]EDP97450.1 mechanosensitive ion channel family protein [Kordia algicida OT-1]
MQDGNTNTPEVETETATDWLTQLKNVIIEYAPAVIAALVILIVGLFVINMVVKLAKRVMEKRGLDATLQKFLGNLLSWTLKILLFVIVASKLGVETTSFAAVIGAAGLAIGLALQGSLSNFAGGVLIMIFKPFKIGDLIEAQGVTGVVKEIQIFTTQLNTPGNKLAIIPNGSLSNGNIINYSAEGILRVDHVIGVSYDADIKQTKEVLMQVMQANDKVLKDPAPTVNVSELADSSVNFAVRPWSTTANYWDVYFKVLEDAKIALDAAGIEIPYPHSVEIHKGE